MTILSKPVTREHHVVALSGGKDSTAMALRLAEVEPREYTYICNPTGDELPDMLEHWAGLEKLLGRPLIRVSNRTLNFWIDHFGALPNWRQRWCTRLLKIEPTVAYLKEHSPALLYVGLRADEEERSGIYSDQVHCRFPLREWGWSIQDVLRYLRDRGVRIPKRSDCARCYGQRLHEWKALYRNHPVIFAEAEGQELRVGATFRSPGRDSMAASLVQLRSAFDAGKMFPQDQLGLFDEERSSCRVCRL
jgi:hypothetical protein